MYNLNTTEYYSTIQEAIDAPETLDGHEISVASGTYYEHITVNKSVSIIGEDRNTTIIDGEGRGKLVFVTASDVEVGNFTLRNGTYGLWLDNSQNSRIHDNTLQDGSSGIRLYYSRNSEVVGNNVTGFTRFGIEIKWSENCTLRDNNMVGNSYNFGVDGSSLAHFIHDIDASNTVNSMPVHYLVDKHSITIDRFSFQEVGYLGLVNSTNIKVENLTVQNNKQGILYAFTENSTISNVEAKNNWNGIHVTHSSDVLVSGNSANNNFDYAIALRSSANCTVAGNNVNNNSWGGISLGASRNCTVVGNDVHNNYYGIHLVESRDTLVSRNSVYPRNGGYSIVLYRSNNNSIYHNNFVNSYLDTAVESRNLLDNGSEGNYWSDYEGIDGDHDGIGDTSYEVGENHVDDHPLMGKFSGFTVTSEGKNYGITVISSFNISEFQFSPDEKRISLSTDGNDTIGFVRINAPNALLQDLQVGDLGVTINGAQLVLNRKWTDEISTYFYFSSESAINPWLVVMAVSILIVTSLSATWFVKRKRAFDTRKRNRNLIENMCSLDPFILRCSLHPSCAPFGIKSSAVSVP